MSEGRWRSAAWYAAASLGLCIMASLLAYQHSLQSNVRDLARAASNRLDYHRLVIETSLEKYETLPFVLAQQSEVTRVLEFPDTHAQPVNAYLERVAAQAKVNTIYVLDPNGTTLVSSNWRLPSSFVGKNYGFRPYFTEAMAGGTGRFFAIGATSGEPGYFLSHPVHGTRIGTDNVARRAVVGVVAVKVLLDELEGAWTRGAERLVLADANGVIFLSSVPAWKYRALAPLPTTVRERLAATQQYGNQPLPQLPSRPALAVDDSREGVRVRIPLEPETRSNGPAFIALGKAVGRQGWKLVSFTDTEAAESAALDSALAAGFATAFVLLLGFYVQLRRRRIAERLAARKALQQASDELEAKIAERTAALEGRVAELKRAEQLLRDTQDQTIQAGKLAVLGQMAAGVTHELNQPLTALRTLSDNATTLLAMGQQRDAAENLRMIGELCERMGSIIQQLKSFSRRSGPRLAPVKVEDAAREALKLLEADCRKLGVRVTLDERSRGACVMGDPIRLEQVLINLVRNAMDAVQASAERRVDVAIEGVTEGDEEAVAVSVRDSGPGIAPEVFAHLFEPFYTTKSSGNGLGLGLTISAAIAETLGGRLRAANAPEGGAVFTLVLPRAASEMERAA